MIMMPQQSFAKEFLVDLNKNEKELSSFLEEIENGNVEITPIASYPKKETTMAKKNKNKKVENTIDNVAQEIASEVMSNPEVNTVIDKAATNNGPVTVSVAKHGFAKLPTYATPGSAACDLHANLTMVTWMAPGETRVIDTGLKVKIPEGYCLEIYSRSGLAANKGVVVLNAPGLIDSDYSGTIGVVLKNFGENKFQLEKGMKIAQMVLKKVETMNWNEITEATLTELHEGSERGDGGFGSTGV